jgi:hypothetical protein
MVTIKPALTATLTATVHDHGLPIIDLRSAPDPSRLPHHGKALGITWEYKSMVIES